MSTAAALRLAMTTIKAAFPAAEVAVVYAGRTAQGVRLRGLSEAAPTMMGEMGSEVGAVRVDVADMDEPALGATITVAGADATVTAVDPDPTGATMQISYNIQRKQAAI